MGITGIVQLKMCGGNLYNDAIDQLYRCTELEIDPADYDGIQEVRFYAVISAAAGESLKLYGTPSDPADPGYGTYTEYADLTHVVSTMYKRMTDVFALPAVKTKFYFFMPASVDMSLNVRTGGIEIDIEDATKARLQMLLFSGDESSGGLIGNEAQNDYWAYGGSSSHPEYGYLGTGAVGGGTSSSYFRLWLKDASKWATVDHWTHEVIGATGSFALYNKTTETMVTGTELSISAAAPTRAEADFADDAANFTDLAEFDGRLKKGTSTALLYRQALYVTLTSAGKAQFELQVGTCIKGYVGGASSSVNTDERFDTESRYLHEPAKFAAGTKFYFEGTAKETGGNASLYMYDCATEDTGVAAKSGLPVAVTSPGSWTNPNKVLLQDNDPAGWTSAIPNETNDISVKDFTVVDWPAGAIINQVEVNAIGNVIEQTAIIQAKINAGSFVSQYLPTHPYPVLVGILFTMPGPWDIATLQSCTVSLRVVHPNNATSTNWYLDYIGLQISYGTDLADTKLDFSTLARERQRTVDLAAALVDGNRYITHVTASSAPTHSIGSHSSSFIIAEVAGAVPPASPQCLGVTASLDSGTMTIGGTGSGANATQWRVVRLSDSAVMDSGVGLAAAFSFPFIGDYGSSYQLQFAGGDGVFSVTGCLFSLAAPAPAVTILPAYWHGGYFGIETPRLMKMFRFGNLVTDNTGFRVMNLLVDHEHSSFRNREIIDFRPHNGLRVELNRKSKLCQYWIQFPDDDVDANVLELSNCYIPLAER